MSEEDCPLSEENWLLFLQSCKSNVITITMSKITAIIALLVFLCYLIYLAELKDNFINSLIQGEINFAKFYFIILYIILIIIVITSIAIVLITRSFSKTMIETIDLEEKIIYGKIKSNDI